MFLSLSAQWEAIKQWDTCLGTSMQFFKFKMSLKWWNRLIKINYSNKYHLKNSITKAIILNPCYCCSLSCLLLLLSWFCLQISMSHVWPKHSLFLRDLRLLIHFSDAFQTECFSDSRTPALLGVNSLTPSCAPCGVKEGTPQSSPSGARSSLCPAAPGHPSGLSAPSTKGGHWQREGKGKGVGISRYWFPDSTAVIQQF